MLTFEEDRIGNGIQVILVPNEDMVIRRGVLVMSRDAAGVFVNGSGHDITIQGSLIAEENAFVTLIGAPPFNPSRMVIGAAGLVQSIDGAGVDGSWGDFTLNNAGTILAHRGAIDISATKAVITNSGRVIGEDGIDLNIFAGGSARIVNDGEIRATGEFGEAIIGNSSVISTAPFTIINRGTIAGSTAVRLGAGNDVLDNHLGRISGGIALGQGNDRFLPGTGVENAQGNDGIDTLDFRPGAGLRVALDGSFAGTGRAKGDAYTGFENILGSARGNDTLRGDDGANRLAGNGGNDRLSGADGQDTLEGGAGRDRLTGGADADRFVFSAGAGADVVTDFNAADGDEIALRAAGFGLPAGDLAAGRFRSGATNQAGDANDRFIFRTGDETLWFDRDGTGRAGPVLIADLGDGVRLTAGNFILI